MAQRTYPTTGDSHDTSGYTASGDATSMGGPY